MYHSESKLHPPQHSKSYLQLTRKQKHAKLMVDLHGKETTIDSLQQSQRQSMLSSTENIKPWGTLVKPQNQCFRKSFQCQIMKAYIFLFCSLLKVKDKETFYQLSHHLGCLHLHTTLKRDQTQHNPYVSKKYNAQELTYCQTGKKPMTWEWLRIYSYEVSNPQTPALSIIQNQLMSTQPLRWLNVVSPFSYINSFFTAFGYILILRLKPNIAFMTAKCGYLH